MGELEFLITKRYAPRELKKKHIRIAEAITPLLGKCTKEEFQKAKEGVETLLEKNHINRRSLFSTLRSLGFEPADARNTPLFEVVPGLVPIRTMGDAWKLVEENLGLVNMVIRYGAKRGLPVGPGWEEKKGVVVRQMFDNALYWDEAKGSFSTYVFSCAGSSRNEIDKMVGPYVIPGEEARLISRIAEERAKNPSVSNAELADALGTNPERIRILDIGRASRYNWDMGSDNIFYSGGEGDGEMRMMRRVSYLEISETSSPPSPEAQAITCDLKKKVDAALSSLPEDRQRLLRRLFGIGERKAKLREIADELRLEVSRVRELADRALSQLRKNNGGELSGLLR